MQGACPGPAWLLSCASAMLTPRECNHPPQGRARSAPCPLQSQSADHSRQTELLSPEKPLTALLLWPGQRFQCGRIFCQTELRPDKAQQVNILAANVGMVIVMPVNCLAGATRWEVMSRDESTTSGSNTSGFTDSVDRPAETEGLVFREPWMCLCYGMWLHYS